MARNFREVFRWLLPSWLTADEGGLVAYSLATLKDIYLERVYQGFVCRLPSYSAGDALAEIGRERGLKQGEDEPSESYVGRLQAWRIPKTHRVRGTAFAALGLAQIAAGVGTFVRTIDAQGTEHTRAADGTEAYSYGNAWTWDPEGATRARFWLELRDVPGAAPNAYSGSAGDLWTDPDGNETVGMANVSPRKMSDLRDLFAQAPAWKPAGTRAMWAIINLTGGTVTPDASWGYWSELVGPPGSAVATPTRDPAFRYVQLTPYPHVERLQWADFVPLLDGTLYAGDPTNPFASNAQTLPKSKRLYAGDPSVFPPLNSVILPDDGDSPR